MKNWLKEKLVNLLGLKHLYVEMRELTDKLDDVDYRLENAVDTLENVDYRCDEVETNADTLMSELRDEMRDEFDKAYSDLQNEIEAFNDMLEGYTITVKLNKE